MKQKGEITAIRRGVNEQEVILCYEVVIEFPPNKPPNLKLGKCEVKQ